MAQTGAQTYTPVAQAEAWRERLQREKGAAGDFDEEYGFLKGAPSKREHGYTTAKYFDARTNSGWTVETLRIPAKNVEEDFHLPEISPNGRATTPSTAFESVLMSASLQRQKLRSTHAHFHTSYSKYGSRLTLEQFGVAHHGIKNFKN